MGGNASANPGSGWNWSGVGVQDPTMNPNAYQYGGKAGGAASAEQNWANKANQQNAVQGAQIQNQYDQRDQGNVQGVLGNQGGLQSYYQGVLSGTQPSLASAQMKAATDQSIAAQMAAANSAKGSLAGAAANRQAASTAAGMQQNAAQQSMVGQIQEEQNAASGLNSLYANQGQLALGEQGLNAQTAYQQAALQQQQQGINAQTALGYGALQNQVGAQQLAAQMQGEAQASNNYLTAQGQALGEGQFDQQQQNAMTMGFLNAFAGMIPDADFVEPSPSLAHSMANHRPAHLTLREERTVNGEPFLAIADQNTGVVEKLATKKLSPAEKRRVMAPHGAGPILSDGPNRMRATFTDMGMGVPANPYGDAPSQFDDPNIQAQMGQLDWGEGQGANPSAAPAGNLSDIPQNPYASQANAQESKGSSSLASKYLNRARSQGGSTIPVMAQLPPVTMPSPVQQVSLPGLMSDMDLNGLGAHYNRLQQQRATLGPRGR
jgi:hypothetical protein